MHDTLFAHQQKLENGYLVEYANDLGLDHLKNSLDEAILNFRLNENLKSKIFGFKPLCSQRIKQKNSIFKPFLYKERLIQKTLADSLTLRYRKSKI